MELKAMNKSNLARLIGFVCFLPACLLLLFESYWDVEDVEGKLVELAEMGTIPHTPGRVGWTIPHTPGRDVDVGIPVGLQRLLSAYPDFLDSADGNMLVWKDGTTMPYDDGVEDKDFETLLNSPDLQDQFRIAYPAGREYCIPGKNSDPGRIRYEPFFLKMYGASPEEVRKNLVPISWLPSTVNRTLLVTSVNRVSERLQAVSDELDALAHLHRYIDDPGGTFHWRPIAGTNRLSPHSFGIAMDVNVKYASYWKWDAPRGERPNLEYTNRVPAEIIQVFEKYGFIWGGKWYHYDTMHFEYRPELLPEDGPTQPMRRPEVALVGQSPIPLEEW